MPIEPILSKLEGVRKRSEGQWSARCPSHNDKSPSLSIKELPDGRVLIRCFAGCGAAEIMESVGLSMRDLMPESLGDMPRVRKPWNPSDALASLTHETAIVKLLAGDLVRGKGLKKADVKRLHAAYERIIEAHSICLKESKWTDSAHHKYQEGRK